MIIILININKNFNYWNNEQFLGPLLKVQFFEDNHLIEERFGSRQSTELCYKNNYFFNAINKARRRTPGSVPIFSRMLAFF